MTPSTVDAAVRLGAKGMRVLPCWRHNKKPAIKDWVRLAACDETIIRRFWGSQGTWSIGVATGRGSGFWATDEDGEEGLATMSRLEAEHGRLPRTVGVATGGGGRHRYWKWPGGVEIRNFQLRDDLPGLDVRGEGGYVLAPPSIHPSGRVYAWSVDSASEFALAPDWLLTIATERSARKANGQAVAPALPEAWARLMERGHEGSHRAAAVARVFGHLIRKFVEPAVAVALAEMFDRERNNEPLGHDEVIRICREIGEREDERRRASER